MALHPSVAKSNVLHRSLHHEPMDIVSGDGIRFTLASGRVIIDASAGPAVSCLGHRQPEVEEAILKQLRGIGYVYSGSRYTCRAAEDLATFLLEDRPGGLSRAIFVNSGSEATDAALKLASQYWCEKGQRQRVNMIARKQSYHGNTLGALSVSGHETRRAFYGHLLAQNTTFVDPCYAYRCKRLGETDKEYVTRLKKQLEDEILRLGPDTVAAFVAETVSGTTTGCVPPVAGYFKAVREVCDKYGVLLILDEVSFSPRGGTFVTKPASRSCVDSVRQEQCMHGNKRASAPTFKQMAKHWVVGSCLFQVYCSTTRSSIH